MSGFEHVRRRIQLDGRRDGIAGRERLRRLVRVAVRQVQDPARDHRRASVGRDVAELRGDERHGNGRGDRELHAGTAHDLDVLGDRPVVDERERLVGPLVPGDAEGERRGAPDRCGHADVAADLEDVVPGARHGGRAGRRSACRRRVERATIFDQPGGRPRRLRSPLAGVGVDVRRRIGPPADEDRDRGFDVDARLTSQPPLPPIDHHRDVVDPRPGHRQPRAHVAPGTEEDLLGSLEVLEGAERHVAIPVGVTGDHERGGLDRARSRRRRSRGASSRPRSDARAIRAPTARSPRSGGCHSSRQPSP